MKNDLTPEQLQQPVSITLPLSAVLALANLDMPAPPAFIRGPLSELPATLGDKYEGGIYAGLSIENERPVALILLPDDLAPTNWKDAMAWAEKQGGALPSRIDQLVLFKNLKSEFKEEWYWSNEQHASDADYAWMQDFASGNQGYDRKSNDYRARAVRRLIIQ